MNRKYSPQETLRSTSFLMVKPLIDNDYEDACYDLAYDLDEMVISFIKIYGFVNYTQIVKCLLQNKELYEIAYAMNENIKKQREFYKMQMTYHLIEYAINMEEANRFTAQANELKAQYGFI